MFIFRFLNKAMLLLLIIFVNVVSLALGQSPHRIELNPELFAFKVREFVDFSLKRQDVQVSLIIFYKLISF